MKEHEFYYHVLANNGFALALDSAFVQALSDKDLASYLTIFFNTKEEWHIRTPSGIRPHSPFLENPADYPRLTAPGAPMGVYCSSIAEEERDYWMNVRYDAFLQEMSKRNRVGAEV